MAKSPKILDSRGNPMTSGAKHERASPHVQGTWDSSKWTWENAKQWSNVDRLSARASTSREVRQRLRERCRYERDNNSYCEGIITTLADDCVGTGAHLHMRTQDELLNRRIEVSYNRWATEIHFATKCHTMRQSLGTDGEAFGLMNTNPAIEGPVQLDVKLVECDQIQTPWLNPIDPLAVDGIRYDIYFNPIEYSMLRYHPGDYFQIGYVADPIDARAMTHWFRRRRPGQTRGIPDLTPALALLPLLRRYTLAVLAAAETAADFAAVLYSELPPAEGDFQACEPWEHFEIERRTMMTIPSGYKVSQIDPKQPAQNYDSFKNQILREVGRCLHMPFNKVAGDSSGYNYSSARLENLEYYETVSLDQFSLIHWVIEPIFKAWLVETSLATDLLEGIEDLNDLTHEWFFDGHGHVDPEKEANSQKIRLDSCTTTLAEEYAKKGQDWEVQVRQRAREIELMKELGFPLQQPGQPLSAARDDHDDDPFGERERACDPLWRPAVLNGHNNTASTT